MIDLSFRNIKRKEYIEFRLYIYTCDNVCICIQRSPILITC